MSYFILPVAQSFFCQLSVEISLVTISPKRTIESFYETAVDEGEVGGGGPIKMFFLGGGLIKIECPILFSSPYFLFRSAAAVQNLAFLSQAKAKPIDHDSECK